MSGWHCWQTVRRGALVPALAWVVLLSGCGGNAPVSPTPPDLSSSLAVAREPLAITPIPLVSGRGEITISGWRRPRLMLFASGDPDRQYRLSFSASRGSTQALEAETVPPGNFRPRNRRDRRIFDRSALDRLRRSGPQMALVGPSPAPPVPVGASRSFWLDVDRPAPDRFVKHTFTLAVATPHAYLWVDDEDADRVDRRSLAELGRYWESVAYPRAIEAFGDVPHGRYDVDGDDHIYILITSTTGDASAYFNSMDMLPVGKDEEKHSNHHKVLVMGQTYVDPRRPDRPQLLATAIHEFQHLINFSQKGYLPALRGEPPRWEEAWLDEGLSVYAEQVGGFGLPGQEAGAIEDVAHFLEEVPHIPIVTAGDSDDVEYSASYLFATYLADRFGPDALQRLVSVPATGTRAVEGATGKPFSEIFANWGVSLYASGRTDDPRYSYRSINLRKRYGGHQFQGIVPTQSVSRYPLQRRFSGKTWSLQFVAFEGLGGSGTFTVGIAGEAGCLPTAVVMGEPGSAPSDNF